MSYRNPKQYIDTQSMQIQQNLQSNLANIGAQTVSNISKVYEENRKKTEEIIKAADTATDKISQNIYQTQAKDPTIKMGNMYEVSKHVNNLMKMDPLTLTDSQRNTISSFKTLGTRMASMLESTYAVNPSDVLAKGKNAPGGLNSYFNPGKTKLILASANKIDSDKTAVFPIDNRGNIGFNVEFRDVGAGGDVKPFGVLNNPIPLEIDTIPDIGKSEEDANKISLGQFLLNDRFSDIYKPIKDKDGIIIEEGEIASETQPNGVTITGRRPVKGRMRKIIDANYFEKSNYETLSKSQKVALYRNLVFKKGGKEFGTVEGSDVIDVTKVTPEDLEYMLQAKLDQNYEVMKQTYPEMLKTLGDIGTLPKDSNKTIPEDYSNIIESWDSNIANDKPENFVNQDISINGSKKTISAASIDPESNELTLSYKSGANDNTKHKTYKLDDNNIHILYKALAGGYNTSFSKSIIAKALKTRKNIKKDSSQITSENTVLDPSNVGVMTEEQQKARLNKLPT